MFIVGCKFPQLPINIEKLMITKLLTNTPNAQD
jgi:hypothetical protein